MKAATVLVTDARLSSATTIIRSLGRAGHRVVATDVGAFSPGLRSRYAAHRARYPDPATDAGVGAVDEIDRLVDRFGVDVVLPATDAIIVPLARARHRFEGRCRLALPTDAALRIVLDKSETVALAAAHGVETPRYAVATGVPEARVAGAELGWPVVVKPAMSTHGSSAGGHLGPETLRGVTYAGDPDDLDDQVGRYEAGTRLLIQEYCPGEGQGVDLLMHEGELLAAFQHRRLREMPPSGGPSSLRESMALDAALVDRSAAMLGAIGWTGLAMVEFKVGPAGPKLMEINGRIWGSFPLAVKAGMDFPGRLVSMLLDGPAALPPDRGYRAGVRSRDLGLELRWIISALRGRRPYPFLEAPSRSEGLAALVGLARRRDGWDLADRSDPLPAAMNAVQAVSFLVGRAASRS